jgi:hypothetical protein
MVVNILNTCTTFVFLINLIILENKDVTIDLYSLGTSFLQKLWEFTEASSANHNKKEEPGGGGGGGEEEEDGEVVEQGEYHSDLEHHRPNGYKYGYSSDHQSDLEDVGHHRHLNDYHDTSDMDIQDDDE